MDLNRKQEIARRAVESISQHLDATAEAVFAELDKLVGFIAEEKAQFEARKLAHDQRKAAGNPAATEE